MKRRYLTSTLLGCLVLFFLVSSAAAQNLRPDESFFIKPRVGIAEYSGDRDPSLWELNEFSVDDNGFPWAGAVEVGYQFSQAFSFSLGYQVANYPTIMPAEWYTRRHTAQALLRFGLPTRVSPFLTLGGHGSVGYTDFSGGEEDDKMAFGPVLGLGLDIVLNDRTSLVFEWLSNFTFSDFDIDGAEGPSNIADADHNWSPEGSQVDDLDDGEPNNDEDFFSDFDALSTLSLGLKLNLKSAFTPVDVMSVDCPATIEEGETATFTAVVNDDDATRPIDYMWDFGDGSTSEGLVATRSFADAGTYTVTFTAMNDGSTDSEMCTVTVEEPPAPASIVSVSADEESFQLCEPTEVDFRANVRGDEPVDYEWNFGDGSTSEASNPSHVYDTPGTYTVTLTVTNEVGSDTRTMTINARPCEPAICQEVTEMNPVFFGRNSSTLTDEARASLRENLEIFEQCSGVCATIRGYAAPGERNPMELSEDRARAVQQFYTDNGIMADRFEIDAEGQVGGTTSKKSGASQYRRADTIPMECGM